MTPCICLFLRDSIFAKALLWSCATPFSCRSQSSLWATRISNKRFSLSQISSSSLIACCSALLDRRPNSLQIKQNVSVTYVTCCWKNTVCDKSQYALSVQSSGTWHLVAWYKCFARTPASFLIVFWRWKQQIPKKQWYLLSCTADIPENCRIFIIINVRASNLTIHVLSISY